VLGMRAESKIGQRAVRHLFPITWLAGTLLVLSGSGLAQNPAGNSDVNQSASIPYRNHLQPELQGPFAAPWLLNEAAFELSAPVPRAASVRIVERTSYKLQPDPSDSTLQQGSPTDDSRSTLSSLSPHVDVAQRIAAEDPSKLGIATKKQSKADAKYDLARIGDRGVGNKLNFYSIEKEQALGRELSQEVEQQAKLIKDPVITEYVNRIGQTLVQHSDAKVPFVIKVVDDEQVNAFALPGGFFYVNSGVLLAADNEAELAGVMAHEIAHVAARHATRNATKQEIWNLASLPLVFIAGPVAAAIRQISSIMVPMSFLKFSRDAEREADFLGIEYEYAAGYDPTAFVDFFEKLDSLEKRKSGFIARAFSTHPMNDDRMRRAEDELDALPARDDYIVSTSSFDEVKARLIRLTRAHSMNEGKSGPTLRKHTVEDKPPVMHKTLGTLSPNLP
jgi:beta-barrel assembly-enhancing protease